jgi:formylglycine-generating enzyme
MGNHSMWALTLLLGWAAGPEGVITMVKVGKGGNSADTNGYGAVNYKYQMGKYEITAGQYKDFLNAVAATDTHGLWTSEMADDWGCQILRAGSSGSYSYSVASAWANRPVNYVSLYDAARFANWLTTGTTTEDGVYKFVAGVLTTTMDHQAAATLYGTAFFLPTENEWYKAAYHNASAGTAAAYFLYPTGTSSTPSNSLADPDLVNNTATFGYPTSTSYNVTVVGDHQNSASPYGTYDQGGNVFEWLENSVLRGGAYLDGASYMASSYRSGTTNSSCQYDNYGFRLASLSAAEVPEPASAAIWLLGAAGLLARRHRKQRLRNTTPPGRML